MNIVSLPWSQVGDYVKSHVLVHNIHIDNQCIKKGTKVILKTMGYLIIVPNDIYPKGETFEVEPREGGLL